MYNIALLSPNKETYSETFIKVHKEKLTGNIKYYYGGFLPTFLEGEGIFSKGSKYYLNWGFNKIFKSRSTLKQAEYQLLQSFLKNKIDIVFAEYGQTGAECLNVCKRLRLPLLVHFHGFDASNKEVLQKYGDKYKEMFEYATFIIVVSKKMKEIVLEYGADEAKVILNYYGPNEMFKLGYPDFSSNNFIAVGRFVDTKAPYYVLFAFKNVLETYPDAKLIMVGDGPLLGDCINIIRYLQIEKKVKLHLTVNHDRVGELLRDSFCFVQHSATTINGDMEGTPNTVLEASISGLPVISTFHAGIPDIIIHGETGLLVNEHDVNKMAEYMCLLFADRSMAEEMGKKGKENISENFNQKKYISILNALVKDSLNYKIQVT